MRAANETLNSLVGRADIDGVRYALCRIHDLLAEIPGTREEREKLADTIDLLESCKTTLARVRLRAFEEV